MKLTAKASNPSTSLTKPHKIWNSTLPKNGRRPHPKWKMTSPKMEDDLTQNARPTKIKMTKNEDDQKLRRPNKKTTKN